MYGICGTINAAGDWINVQLYHPLIADMTQINSTNNAHTGEVMRKKSVINLCNQTVSNIYNILRKHESHRFSMPLHYKSQDGMTIARSAIRTCSTMQHSIVMSLIFKVLGAIYLIPSKLIKMALLDWVPSDTYTAYTFSSSFFNQQEKEIFQVRLAYQVRFAKKVCKF
jgi:hypothetical protein